MAKNTQAKIDLINANARALSQVDERLTAKETATAIVRQVELIQPKEPTTFNIAQYSIAQLLNSSNLKNQLQQLNRLTLALDNSTYGS